MVYETSLSFEFKLKLFYFILFCREWLDGIDSEKSKKLLRTQYHAVETTLVNPLAVKW